MIWHHSEVAREKIRQANLGRKASAETRAKMSATRIGKKLHPHTEEAKEKMRVAALGRRASTETRAKMSAARRGKPHPHKGTFHGKRHSAETKAKIHKALLGRTAKQSTKEKMSAARKGIPKSEETRRRMSESQKDPTTPANRSRREATSRNNVRRGLLGLDFNVKGYHISPKAKGSVVPYRSTSIELRLMQLFDATPEVVMWESPFVVRFVDADGTKRHALPDFLVTYADGHQVVVEGKGPHLVDRYIRGTKCVAVEQWCIEHRVPFLLAITTNRTKDILWKTINPAR